MRTITFSLCLAAAPAFAEMDFVTDRALCPLELFERQEQGMSFDGKEFFEIEYFCEIAEPILALNYNRDLTHITAGYCEEPGALFPDVFVFRAYQSEPGTLYVYQGDSGEGVAFFDCRW